MYHALGEPGEPAARFVVPIRAFERQMAWLARLRFNVVRLDAAVHALLALPVLQRYAFPATAFVVTAAMGKSVSWSDRPGLARRPLMTWAEALELEPPRFARAAHAYASLTADPR